VIALETNVIARYIIGDDHAHQRAVARLLADDREEFFLSDTVLAEFVWVLDSIYGYSREDIGSALEALIHRSDMVFEDEIRVRRAVRYFLDGEDFTDFLILARAQASGCTALASFDKGLKKRFPDFVVVPS
jgi:predicted nucleic-acid-binding protein